MEKTAIINIVMLYICYKLSNYDKISILLNNNNVLAVRNKRQRTNSRWNLRKMTFPRYLFYRVNITNGHFLDFLDPFADARLLAIHALILRD